MKVLTEKEVAQLCETPEGFTKLVEIAKAVSYFTAPAVDIPVITDQVRVGFGYDAWGDERGKASLRVGGFDKPGDKV